jgi:hypothetical protein
MPETTETPIACLLEGPARKDRLDAITGLNARALKRSERRDLVLTLVYAPHAIAEVREMIAKEQCCCAFLAFAVEESPEEIRVMVTAPEAAREAADTVFAPLNAGGPTLAEAPACRCGKPDKTVSASVRSAAGLATAGLSGAVIACAAACALPALVPAAGLSIMSGVFTAFAGGPALLVTAAVCAAILASAWLVARRTARQGQGASGDRRRGI